MGVSGHEHTNAILFWSHRRFAGSSGEKTQINDSTKRRENRFVDALGMDVLTTITIGRSDALILVFVFYVLF